MTNKTDGLNKTRGFRKIPTIEPDEPSGSPTKGGGKKKRTKKGIKKKTKKGPKKKKTKKSRRNPTDGTAH